MAVDKKITGVANPDLEVEETVDVEASDIVFRSGSLGFTSSIIAKYLSL